CARGPGWFAYW
nr:immunoglobulin heavy chain junction region [Mus musculus]